MEDSFAEQHTFFARLNDSIFLADRERVKTITDLYEHYECIWNVQQEILGLQLSHEGIAKAAMNSTMDPHSRPARR